MVCSGYAVVHTNYTPLSKNPHLEPRFSDGGWVGRFRFLCCVVVLDVAAAPVEGGGPTPGPTLPLWGRVEVTYSLWWFGGWCWGVWGERVFLVCWSWWVGDRCRWDLGGMGVLAGYCCFCVV